MNQVDAISVTRLARRIRNLLEIEIGEIWVEGEISNLRRQASGHWYFSLKDEDAQISCAMFGARRREGAEVIEDGAKVQLFGEVSFYEARGGTQLIVRKAQAVGKGDLQARFEALKKKLKTEGLFDPARKRELPFFPRVIGLVTSPSGAALQDMLNVLSRRAPWIQVVLFPTAVQGKGAEREVAASILSAAKHSLASEVLIVGRGGGSLEDLWNFNEEVVARAIAQSPIPVISAVGHEIDFTIADFVADLRAPTPSAAAELVVPDGRELNERYERVGQRLERRVFSDLERLEDRLDRCAASRLGQSPERLLRGPVDQLDQAQRWFLSRLEQALTQKERLIENKETTWKQLHPYRILDRREELIETLEQRMDIAASVAISQHDHHLRELESSIRLLSPEGTLKRGYSIVLNQSGDTVTSPQSVKMGESVTIQTAGGEIKGEVRPSST